MIDPYRFAYSVLLFTCICVPNLRAERVLGPVVSDEEDIDSRFSFVEIWDVKGRSRRDFLKEITSLPAGICQQSLVQMGHPNGFKFPLSSGKLLVTTRNPPDFRDTDTYRRLSQSGLKVDSSRWMQLSQANLKTTESQLLPRFVPSLEANDPVGFEKVFEQQRIEFGHFGIKLERQKVRQAFGVYQQATKTLTKDEVLYVLYFSQDEQLLSAASFIVGHYIRSAEDLVSILPLLLTKRANVQAAVSTFLSDLRERIEWRTHKDLFPKLMDNPNPFVTVLFLKILDKTGFDSVLMEDYLKSGHVQSFVEILSSDVLPDEKCYVLSFLNRYTNSPIECDAKEWLKRLQLR